MSKREVYTELLKDYVNLVQDVRKDLCCYNYNNEQQQANGCDDKDCDECQSKFYSKMYSNGIDRYDNEN